MILVRDIFRLRFGRSREAIALLREGLDIMRRSGGQAPTRVLTDLTGPYYTLVLESVHENLAAFERDLQGELGSDEWRTWYARFVPLVETGRRELFTIVDDRAGARAGGAAPG